MKPVKFEQSNCTLGGEVPARRELGIVLTRWAGCWRERTKFLLFGKLWLSVQGETMPPTLVTSDRAFRIVNPPDDHSARQRIKDSGKPHNMEAIQMYLEANGYQVVRPKVKMKARARGGG